MKVGLAVDPTGIKDIMGILLATLFHYFDDLNEMSEFPGGRELSIKTDTS